MTSRAALALSSALLLALSGCKTIHHITHDDTCNKPEPYQRASSITPLAIPQGMSTPDTSHALEVPPLNEPPPPPRTVKDPCLAAPPTFNVPQPNAPPGE
jgi:uncharacterized lipoprotein